MAHGRTPQESAAIIEWLFNNSREVMFVIGADKRFKLINPAFERETGWTPDEVVGQFARDFIHPDEDGSVNAHMQRLAEQGYSDHASRIRTKDGGWRWFEGRAQLTEDGQVIGVVRDATQDRANEARLIEAERTSRMLSQAAGIGSWSYEPDEDLVEWSRDILAITGYAPEEISNAAQFEAVLHPEDRAWVQKQFIAGVVRGEPRSFEHRMKTKGGRWTHWRATFQVEPRPSGVHALRGVSQNITELVEARDAALRSRQQMLQLIESSPNAVAMFDKQLRYMVVSDSWRATFVSEDGEAIGQTLSEAFTGAPKRLLAAQKRALAGEVVASKEDRLTVVTGDKRWVRWQAGPWRDAKGRVQGVVCYVDDVTPLARARREAEANAQRLKVALNAADAGVYEIDHVQKTFWASPEFEKLVGRDIASYDDAQSLQFPRFHFDDIDHVRQAFKDFRDGVRAPGEAFEARAQTPSGERWIRVFHHLSTDRKGRWLKGVGLVQDFDQRKREELQLIEAQRAAQAAGEAKAAFLANMSHEIRTPMNGVMGVLHLLKSEGLSDDGRRMLEEALSCGQMLSELLNDVIDFSKIEAGRLEMAHEPVDPKALIEGVARLLRPQAEEKNLALRVEVAPDIGWVMSDPVRLRQALFNLVGNAVKFTLKGHVTVRADLRPGPDGPVLRLEIADTGVGIPEAVQPRIFQRFDQGDASTTRKFGGSGLGLSITQRLAEMMGGGVGFTSTEGVGSEFWLEVAAEPAAPASAAEEAGDDDWLNGLQVLVVEDNATNRMIATKLLENLGAVVETASDGFEGVDAASRGGFDLILMDVQMPGIDGLEAARRIRAQGGAVAATPIVALTANVLSHQRQAYLDAGMDGVVGKPISPGALLAEISRLAQPESSEAPRDGDASDGAAAVA